MNLRGRPKKLRIVKNEPKIRQFSPRGKPGRPHEIDLKIEEFEALRLADFKGQKQQEAAQNMQISQQTFSRVLSKARRSLAEALIMGKIIRIQGGHYSLKQGLISQRFSRKTHLDSAQATPRTPQNL